MRRWLAVLMILAGALAAGAALPEGVALLPPDSAGAFKLVGLDDGSAKVETVAVEGQKFTRALRARTLKQPANSWLIQLSAKTVGPVEKGDVLLATFWLRAVEPAGGEAHTAFIFELAKAPWPKSIEYPLGVGPAWKEFHLPFVAAGSYAAGEASINFHLGYPPQVIEIGGVTVTSFGKKVKLSDLPRTGLSYSGIEADAPWRREAAERIEKLRKADLTVRVQDKAGRPAANAEVKVRMTRHAFGFGSAVAARSLNAETENGRKYRDNIKQMFNKVVFENDLKWFAWDDPGNRAAMFSALDWLKEQGIEVRGHCLVWPGWANLPPDLRNLKNDPEALRRRIDNHVRQEATLMRGRLVEWDVINEPYSNHDVMDVLGNDVMAEWFKAAREADPAVQLFINDYSILGAGGRDAAHQAHYEKTMRFLLDKGAPLGGIGMQGHFNWQLTPPVRLLEVLDRFAALGLPIEVTEFDVDITDEQLQADYLRDFMTAVFSHPKVKGILMWGFWEGYHWRPNAALFRKDWSVKPNGQAWMDLVLKTWWTETEGKAGAGGEYKVRGFQGDYEVTAKAGGRTKNVRVSLPPSGATVTVTMD